MGRYAQHPSALFLTDFPPIYPLLERSVCYIGDYSSIGYDFLVFDRPLFFIPSSKSPSSSYTSPLYRCGLTLLPEDLAQIKEKIYTHCEGDSASYSAIRQQTYLYAFGREKTPERLHQDIFNGLHGQNPQ